MDALDHLIPGTLSLAPALDAYHNVLILDLERRIRAKAEARRASNAIVVSLLARDAEARQRYVEQVVIRAIETEFGMEESR